MALDALETAILIHSDGAMAVMAVVLMHPRPPDTSGGLHVPSQKQVLDAVATTRKDTVLGTPVAHFGNIMVMRSLCFCENRCAYIVITLKDASRKYHI